MDEKNFDALLEKAFEIQNGEQISREPSLSELSEAAPFTEKQLEYINKICKKEKKPLWTRYIGRAAAILLCVALTGFGVMMTDPDVRATVGENIAEFVDECINIDFSQSSKVKSIDIAKTEIGYIPDGFALTKDLSDDEKLSYVYTDGDENYLFIDVVSSGDIFISYELEDHNVVYVNVNGYDGYLTYDEDTCQGSVCWGNSNFTVVISGFVPREQLLKTAENITVKK